MSGWSLEVRVPWPSATMREFSPTRGACEAAVLLGMCLERPALRGAAREAPPLAVGVTGGAVTLVTGPSGAGKSTLLAEVMRRAAAEGVAVVDAGAVRRRAGACVEQFGADVRAGMRWLARAGLADGRCMVRRPAELSVGQRARLQLALAMRRAERLARRGSRVLLVCDELTSTLDGATARGVAHLLGKWALRTPGVAVLAAGVLDELGAWVGARRVIELSLGGEAALRAAPGASPSEPELVIEPGRARDLGAMEHEHYREEAARAVVRVLTARAPCGALAGVLAVSMPVMNGRWRAIAWPGEYERGGKTERARRLNDEVRCISRVIVDPRWRGMGVARRLVKAYLRDALTVRTEAVAAMGSACPFFERAGMRRIDLGVPTRHARLRDAMRFAGVEPWRLAMPRTALARAIDARGAEFVMREVRRWGWGSRAERRLARGEVEAIFARASARVGLEAAAFVSEREVGVEA